MIKTYFSFSILILLSACVSTTSDNCNYIEDYYQKIYEAEFKYQIKAFEEASDLYKSAFKTCTPINTPIYNEIGKYAQVSAVLGNDKEALKYIKIDLANGSMLKWYLQDSVFRGVFVTRDGQRIIEKYDDTRTKYLTQVNLELRKKIQEMNRLDQYYRYPVYDEKKQDSIDRINEKSLIAIFDTLGYPNEKIIGTANIDGNHIDIATILLHTDDSIRISYFIPKLTHFVRNGECPPQVLGSLIDQLALYNGLPQTHGTYKTRTSRYAKMIENRQIINSNRISIGLPSLEMEEKLDSLKLIN